MGLLICCLKLAEPGKPYQVALTCHSGSLCYLMISMDCIGQLDIPLLSQYRNLKSSNQKLLNLKVAPGPGAYSLLTTHTKVEVVMAPFHDWAANVTIFSILD